VGYKNALKMPEQRRQADIHMKGHGNNILGDFS
jgi:hypothetical protein